MEQCQFIIQSKGRRCLKPVSHNGGRFCHWHQHKYFVKDTTLAEDKQKWCRCVLHVASKQPAQCLEDVAKNSGKIYDGKTCYNPYSICSASVKTSSRACGENYNFTGIPDNELVAYAIMKKLPIPEPYTRTKMLRTIKKWKATK